MVTQVHSFRHDAVTKHDIFLSHCIVLIYWCGLPLLQCHTFQGQYRIYLPNCNPLVWAVWLLTSLSGASAISTGYQPNKHMPQCLHCFCFSVMYFRKWEDVKELWVDIKPLTLCQCNSLKSQDGKNFYGKIPKLFREYTICTVVFFKMCFIFVEC